MGRYLIFAGSQYYPVGGWRDLKHSSDSVLDALEWVANTQYEWWQIVDSDLGDLIKDGWTI